MGRPSLTLVNFCVLCLAIAFSSGCSPSREEGGTVTIVFKHGVIAGRADPFRKLLDVFEKENPGIRVKNETLPSSTDEQHQFYVINLEGASRDFDVLSLDVIWVPEFARAGWLMDLTHLLPESGKRDFFPGLMEAATFKGEVYAIPWYIDAGVLFYRTDLLAKHGIAVPRSWGDLASAAQYIASRERGIHGFVWQGKQYEGLVCNMLEYLWSNGGSVLHNGKPVIDSQANRQALAFTRNLIVTRASPSLVTTATEETTREIFGSGRAVFMRNWPYAWNIFQREGSPVRGRVAVTELPSFPGHSPAPALGGWQLGINRHSRNREAAARLVKFLTSVRVQKELALNVGYQPVRRSLYEDAEFKEKLPFVAGLYTVFTEARPRPVTPYYMMITQVLQSEFSATISGIRTPEAALASADRQIRHVLEVER
ncbi:MAG: putative ABC transporter-binding protein precursor [Syntrophorhabdaceae bacterium PtaU1.Bin034]|nr:MAG: putative ABC transporter-binding protein precursor [Syntrophorhabdaceae bacterium PtaU1.Bin034]